MENKSITIRDVAKAAGVSVSTVSRAFNNYSDISDATRESILKVAEEIGYKPNNTVKSANYSKHMRFGMLIEDFEPTGILNPSVFEILLAFKNAAAKFDYEVILLSTTSDTQSGQNLSALFEDKKIDGLFIMGLRMTDEYYKQLNSIKYPCVLFDININNPALSCVGIDNMKGAFMAVEHLINLGHKKIGFINGHKEAYVSYERLDGYYLAHHRYNIEINQNLVKYGDFSDKSAEAATEELIRNNKDITAIFCASDLMAVGAVNMLNNLGYSIPEDISVVGFDDIYIAQYMTPKLTTIRQNRVKIGENAANLLMNLINGQIIDRVVIQPELIIRESTKNLVQNSTL